MFLKIQPDIFNRVGNYLEMEQQSLDNRGTNDSTITLGGFNPHAESSDLTS